MMIYVSDLRCIDSGLGQILGFVYTRNHLNIMRGFKLMQMAYRHSSSLDEP
jgi:hypothetical protein